MASSIKIHCRIPTKSKRLQIDDVKLSAKVADFKSRCAKALDIAIHELDLVYCGQRLQDARLLESYDIKTGVTIHVLKKQIPEGDELIPEKMDHASIHRVVTALKTALGNPAYRNTVEHMLAKPETLENLIAATPGLDKDPVAMAMLQEPDLLGVLADPAHIHKVIEAHPAIGQAAMLVAAAVNEEGANTAESRNTGRATYSLDQMSDDEDMPLARGPVTAITANQLAAALAAAGGGPAMDTSSQPSSSGSSQPSSSQSASEAITSDFFRQALFQVAGNGGQAMAPPPAVTEAQLLQMRDMGITDESAARHALEATGGDIQAALELIFGDGGGF